MNKNNIIFLSDSITHIMSRKIDKKFHKNKNNKKLAKECLSLCREWTLVHRDDLTNDRKLEKALCKKYVKNNIKNSEKYGNFLLSALFSVLVKLIIEWVVENYIKDLIVK